jgi:hypothetical protein
VLLRFEVGVERKENSHHQRHGSEIEQKLSLLRRDGRQHEL